MTDMQACEVTPFNVNELSALSGRTKKELLRQYWDAKNQGSKLYVFLHKPAIDPELLGKCYYNYHWFASREAGKWICMIHNQESKYQIEEGSRLPCLALDPTA